MKPIIFTLVGQDKPGLISNLAQTVYDMGGNWLGSNFSHMAGHFAGFVQIDLPENKHQLLTETFQQHPDLKIHLISAELQSQPQLNKIKLEITGNDRSGIVQEVTKVLHQFDLNIHSFTSTCESAPNWGGQLFKAEAVILVTDEFDIHELTETLEDVANDLMVDITKLSQAN